MTLRISTVKESPAAVFGLERERHPMSAVMLNMTKESEIGLYDSIRDIGIIDPIAVLKRHGDKYDGFIVDGWHRYTSFIFDHVDLAAWESEYEQDEYGGNYMRPKPLPSAHNMRYVELEGDDGDIWQYVKSRNLNRKHQTVGQRAVIADRMSMNTGQGRPENLTGVRFNWAEFGNSTLAVAAGECDVSERSIQRVRSIRENAKRLGIVTEYRKIESGELGIGEVYDKYQHLFAKKQSPSNPQPQPPVEAPESPVAAMPEPESTTDTSAPEAPPVTDDEAIDDTVYDAPEPDDVVTETFVVEKVIDYPSLIAECEVVFGEPFHEILERHTTETTRISLSKKHANDR